MRKLLFTLPSEGRIVGEARRDGGPLYDGIREAIINACTYSDFQTEGVLRIDRRDKEIIMRNPGLLRISTERIYNGDFTHARNRNIQKMFRMIGYGDNIGSGFQKILAAWKTLGLTRPALKELEDVREVWLTLPLVGTSKKGRGTNNEGKTSNSTEYGVDLHNPGQEIDNLGQEKGQVNPILGQVMGQVDLSDKQKEVLIYLINNPSTSLKACSYATGASPKSIRYTFKKVKSWLDIRHEGPDKTGKWCFELIKEE